MVAHGELSGYTVEMLRDVAEAKAAGGHTVTHYPAEKRVSRQQMVTAETELMRYGIQGRIVAGGFKVTW